MAQKDWKKTRDNSFGKTWEKENKSRKVVVVLSNLKSGSKLGIVESDLQGDNSNIIHEKFYDTKSQALRFAKQYMRTH